MVLAVGLERAVCLHLSVPAAIILTSRIIEELAEIYFLLALSRLSGVEAHVWVCYRIKLLHLLPTLKLDLGLGLLPPVLFNLSSRLFFSRNLLYLDVLLILRCPIICIGGTILEVFRVLLVLLIGFHAVVA